MKKLSKIPCLIIAYTRTEIISELLHSLNIAQVESIYLAIDGPKNENDLNAQKQILNAVSGFCHEYNIPLYVWQRKVNSGLAVSIITSIDWFFQHVDFGVILEDDLVLGIDFFNFILANENLLAKYENLLLISGSQFFSSLARTDSLNWTNYPLIWGWATSRQKWNLMRSGILKFDITINFLSFNKILNFWKIGALRTRLGYVDTWDIPLAYFMLKTNKLCLTPPENLVTNKGADIYASHTTSDCFPLNISTKILPLKSRFILAPISSSVRSYNKLLEKRVFNIKFRHSVIQYVYVVKMIFTQAKKNQTLNQKLELSIKSEANSS